MKTHVRLSAARRAVRMYLLSVLPLVLAAALPGPLLAQPIYSTPYTITTLAGLAGVAGTNDGTGSAARFDDLCGVALDSTGNLYVADELNSTIRKVTPTGVVTTLAGLAGVGGTNDGTGSAARFYYPSGVAVDSTGNVYVADFANDTIRKVTATGVVTTLAGLAGSYGTNDGTGNAARFNGPDAVAVDSTGNVYVAELYNSTIRKLTPAGIVTTLAGLAQSFGSTDGTGSTARFFYPYGVAVDSAGTVYVADSGNSTIRSVTPEGLVTTLAGLARNAGTNDGTGSAARFSEPDGVAVCGMHNLYVVDEGACLLRKVTLVGTNWVVTTLAGLAYNIRGDADGTGSAARFVYPGAVAVDSASNAYVADTQAYTIRKGFPASSVPAPILESPTLSGGQFGFGITGLPNLAVNIESSGDLLNWQVVGTNVLVDGTNSFSEPTPPQGIQFYRVQVR